MLNTKYSSVFKNIYNFFSDYMFDVSFFDFSKIYYTDDLKKDLSLFDITVYDTNISSLGVTIFPNDVLSEIVVLIDVSSNDFYTFTRTLIHELIHIYDYNSFSQYYLAGQYDNISKHKLFDAFGNWTEFRAFSLCDFYATKYANYIAGLDYSDSNVMSSYKEDLKSFILKTRKRNYTSEFSIYDISRVLGYIYTLDFSQNITEMEESNIFEYLPYLLHTEVINQIYNLYEKYFYSLQNQNVFDVLQEISDIENKIYLGI